MDNEPKPTDENSIAEEGNDDLLVAYLDGELDAQQTNELERRLSEDSELRRRLHELQKTWDVLDCLPHALTAEKFTKSTIELVTREATRELYKRRRTQPVAWLSKLALAAFGGLMFWGGFQTVRMFQTAQTRALARDLRVIENLDLYRSINDLEFLQQLEQAGLFVSEDDGNE